MAQHDYVIANGTGAAVRSDLNNALAAIVSQNSGATEPATMYAYQWWADTTTGLLKIRNAANNAWVTVGTLASANLGLLSSGGTITAALGSASTPGITFTGDTNTGIYSPGTDQVAISTNGSGRLFVDSSGRVGVGASIPGTNLHVAGSSASALIEATGGTSADFLIGDGTVRYYGIRGVAGGGSLQIRNHTANTTLATFTSTGAVGIGTTSPVCLINGQIPSATSTSTEILRLTDSVYCDLKVKLDRVTTVGNSVCRINTASGNLAFETSDTERARIDSSGRLLVGTSTARANFFNGSAIAPFLQIEGTGSARMLSVFSNNTDGGVLVLGRQGGSTPGGNTLVANNDEIGIISFQASDGTDPTECARIQALIDGAPGNNDTPGRLVFSTTADGASSPTERMRIGQNGYTKFGISGSYEGGNIHEFNGGENTGACLVVRWTPSGLNSGNGFVVKTPNTAAATTHNLIAGDASAGNVFRVRADGNVYNTNGVYGSTSDVKLKENIVDASSQWSDIKALRVRKYNFKEGLTHTQIGVIAQEVEQVSPGLVYETPDRDVDGNETGEVTKGVNYSVLYMKAVKALQEAMDRIEQLEQRLTDAGIA